MLATATCTYQFIFFEFAGAVYIFSRLLAFLQVIDHIHCNTVI